MECFYSVILILLLKYLKTSSTADEVVCYAVDLELIRIGVTVLTCPVQQSSSFQSTAGLCSAGLMSRGSSWRSSLICCQTAGSLSPALITSSALYYSFLYPVKPPALPHPLALSLFFNLIMEPSTPPEQAAMLAAGEGIILSEHVSVSRYRSTCGVNLAWRSRAILLCAREYEMRQKWWGRSGEMQYMRGEACGLIRRFLRYDIAHVIIMDPAKGLCLPFIARSDKFIFHCDVLSCCRWLQLCLM